MPRGARFIRAGQLERRSEIGRWPRPDRAIMVLRGPPKKTKEDRGQKTECKNLDQGENSTGREHCVNLHSP